MSAAPSIHAAAAIARRWHEDQAVRAGHLQRVGAIAIRGLVRVTDHVLDTSTVCALDEFLDCNGSIVDDEHLRAIRAGDRVRVWDERRDFTVEVCS